MVVWSSLLACRAPEPPERPHEQWQSCPAEPGTICGYVGDGTNGFNGDEVHRLEVWLSFPRGIAFPPDLGQPALVDYNNRAVRMVDELPEDGLDTVIESGKPPGRLAYEPDGRLLVTAEDRLLLWDPVRGQEYVLLRTAGERATDVLSDGDGARVYWLDTRNRRIQVLDRDTGAVSTVMSGEEGYCGEGDALSTCLGFFDGQPEQLGGLALDEEGQRLYLADSGNHAVRVLDLETGQTALVAGAPGVAGFRDGEQALFSLPTDVALDGETLFVADTDNHRVRAIDLATGKVSTVAGTGQPTCEILDLLAPAVCDEQHTAGDGGPALQATLYRPFGVDLDPYGHLIVADTYDHRLRIIFQ
jgi:DNA-binding beta-propeller fold protein YncE